MELRAFDVLLSALRWLGGLTLGTTSAILAAVALRFVSQRLRETVVWLMDFVRALPIFGLVPLIQYIDSVEEPGKIVLISYAAFFPVFFSVNTALSNVLLDEEVFFRALKTSAWQRLRLDGVPRVVRGTVLGVDISIGLAWITVVAAEFIGTKNYGFWSGGLGNHLWRAFEGNQVRLGVEDLCIFGVLGLLASVAWRQAGRGVL